MTRDRVTELALSEVAERQALLADQDATCPVCGHLGLMHDSDGCHDASDLTDPDGVPYRCSCRVPLRLVRAVVAVPGPQDAERWNLTADAWYALEDAENARADFLDDDDGYDWNTPRYDVEGTRPWDWNA